MNCEFSKILTEEFTNTLISLFYLVVDEVFFFRRTRFPSEYNMKYLLCWLYRPEYLLVSLRPHSRRKRSWLTSPLVFLHGTLPFYVEISTGTLRRDIFRDRTKCPLVPTLRLRLSLGQDSKTPGQGVGPTVYVPNDCMTKFSNPPSSVSTSVFLVFIFYFHLFCEFKRRLL